MRFIRLTRVRLDRVSGLESIHPVVINVAAIRCFYPRSGGAVGTRFTFVDGGGFAVSEPFEVVRQLIEIATENRVSA